MSWKNFIKPSPEDLKKRLTDLQFKVTQGEGTEPPFQNEYDKNKRAGIYVDVVSGEPLFSSTDKFDSGTGWPSFTKPLDATQIETHTDFKLLYPRTEVRSKLANSHLGHVFEDGPAPTGMRYCMNSSSLRFIPAEDLEREGYGEFLSLFQNETAQAIFAGGCFWCMEPPFTMQPGVLKVEVGYTGGTTTAPTYEQVCSDQTGHLEAVRVTYDPKNVSYDQLLEIFWQSIDPTDAEGQFADRGKSYQSAIFVANEQQRQSAEASKQKLGRSGVFTAPIATEIRTAKEFYPAEDYHQNYHQKNPERYNAYKIGSGRQHFLDKTWKSKKTLEE